VRIVGDGDAFAAFMRSVDDAKDSLELRTHQECFIRGHRDTTYTLLPSLFSKRDRTGEEFWRFLGRGRWVSSTGLLRNRPGPRRRPSPRPSLQAFVLDYVRAEPFIVLLNCVCP
jgi:hypothetical protein